MSKKKVEKVDFLNIADTQVHNLANEHRQMTEVEFEALKMDMQENGQLVPIITYKGRCVDGRHRMRALEELGEVTIKAIKLPGNISIAQVRKKVMGTEKRRSDNVMQKAIRAYKLYLEEDLTQEEAGVSIGVSQTDVSLAKKLHEQFGINFLDGLYELGYVYAGKKRLSQMRQILKAFDVKKKDEGRGYEPPTERVSLMYQNIKAMKEEDSLEELSLILSRVKNAIKALTTDT